jgi:hypothetical protein
VREGSFHQQIGFKFKEEITKCYTWSIALYGTETWKLRKIDQKYVESFNVWCWGRMEQISWTDRVRNEEVYHIEPRKTVISYIR